MNTDIFGANLYHRYLTRQRSGRVVSGIAAAITGRGNHSCELEIETEDVHASAEECHSILVQVNYFTCLLPDVYSILNREYSLYFLFYLSVTDWCL